MGKYAQQFRTSLTNADKGEVTKEVTIEGVTFLARRVPFATWIRSGRIPQVFVKDILRVSKGEIRAVDHTQYEVEDQLALLDFQKRCIIDCFVDPVIVEGEPANDAEINYQSLVEGSPKLIDAIITWVLTGQPDIPVAMTTGGTTTLDSVASFREKRPGGIRLATDEDSETEESSAERAIAD